MMGGGAPAFRLWLSVPVPILRVFRCFLLWFSKNNNFKCEIWRAEILNSFTVGSAKRAHLLSAVVVIVVFLLIVHCCCSSPHSRCLLTYDFCCCLRNCCCSLIHSCCFLRDDICCLQSLLFSHSYCFFDSRYLLLSVVVIVGVFWRGRYLLSAVLVVVVTVPYLLFFTDDICCPQLLLLFVSSSLLSFHICYNIF